MPKLKIFLNFCRIWDYLLNLAQVDGTAIVITTHYIEETKLAHRVKIIKFHLHITITDSALCNR